MDPVEETKFVKAFITGWLEPSEDDTELRAAWNLYYVVIDDGKGLLGEPVSFDRFAQIALDLDIPMTETGSWADGMILGYVITKKAADWYLAWEATRKAEAAEGALRSGLKTARTPEANRLLLAELGPAKKRAVNSRYTLAMATKDMGIAKWRV
jgi:hypothetical protein